MSHEHLLVEKLDGGVGVVTFNRPDRLNAFNNALRVELTEVLGDFETDDEIRCIVITGAGEKAFSAGADIHELASATPSGPASTDFWWDVANLGKPTIGAINGLAYGGAALLASSLDIRVGCDRSSFRFLAASYGRINSTWTLPMVVGWAKAKELLYTGRVVDADEALQIGLLNELVPAGEVLPAAIEMGARIAANPPEAVQGIKRLLIEDMGRSWREMHDAEQAAIAAMNPAPASEAFKDFLGSHTTGD